MPQTRYHVQYFGVINTSNEAVNTSHIQRRQHIQNRTAVGWKQSWHSPANIPTFSCSQPPSDFLRPAPPDGQLRNIGQQCYHYSDRGWLTKQKPVSGYFTKKKLELDLNMA